MTTSPSGPREAAPPAARRVGVRARLLLAFFAIAAFAVLAAVAGIHAFRTVGDQLEAVDRRVPPTLAALDLSRSVERVIAAAPRLLAAGDRIRGDEVNSELAAEVDRIHDNLRALTQDHAPDPQLREIEAAVTSLTARLDELDRLVALRLAGNERLGALRRDLFRINAEVQRLLAPWLEVLDYEISTRIDDRSATTVAVEDATANRLADLVAQQRLTEAAQRQVSSVVDLLADASTAEQPQRLSVLAFQLGLAQERLDDTASGLDARLRPLFLEQAAALRSLVDGPAAITTARRQELALVTEGRRLVADIAAWSTRLTAAVDRLGESAKRDINQGIHEALAVQRLSTRVLVALVALSLLSSIVIVWLYVGRNIVRRLTSLSDGMLAIAGGRLGNPVAVHGTDEIAAMAEAVEVFRRNAIELDRLLEERRQSAARLERQVAERTRDLSESLRQQTAIAEVLKVISRSTFQIETVLATLVGTAARLCRADGGFLLREGGSGTVVRCGSGEPAAGIESSRVTDEWPPDPGTAVGRAVAEGCVVQMADGAPGLPPWQAPAGEPRTALLAPLVREGRPIGVLGLVRGGPQPFSDQQVEVVATLADQALIAIENVRLFHELEDKGRQLEAASRFKSQFLASAGHDLRQPLHALNLFVSQLRDEPDAAGQRRLLGRIEAAVGSMNELFGTLLDMARLEAGALEPNLAEFPVQRVLERIETACADSAAYKGLRLAVISSRAWVRSDPLLLERILMNLVANAVRHTARGGIVLGCRRRDGRLRIDVCDSGPGIPADQQRTIFGEYVRLASGPDSGSGFGLGLAIVDRLARLLGHEVGVASRVGRGSRFSVSVPMLAAPPLAAEVAQTAPIADPLRGRLVIVIDDDPLVLEGMGGILRSWGCEVWTADGEAAALAAASTFGRAPDLVIADCRLAGGTTGIEAIAALRGALGAAIPAFLVSGDTAPERLREARRHGLHLLHKPIPPLRLRAMATRLLGARTPGADAIPASDPPPRKASG